MLLRTDTFKTAFFITVFFLFIKGVVCAQSTLKFDHLSVENGMSQSSVLSIVQDAQGFMWFGTRYGLNKYNTRNFKIYKNNPADSNSLSSQDFIRALLSDRQGVLWVGSSNGLNKYAPDTDSFERLFNRPGDKNSLSANSVNCMLEDKSGSVWVGTTNGLNLLTDRIKNKFKSFFLNRAVYALAQDNEGIMWIGTSGGLVKLQMNQGKWIFQEINYLDNSLNSIRDNYITTIIAGDQDDLWIGTKHGGLIRLNKRTGAYKIFTHTASSNSLISNHVRKIIRDKKGRFWIGTLKGLSIMDPKTETFTSWQHDSDDKTSLSQNSIYDIFQDRTGTIWIGTYYGGINVVYPNQMPFRVYQNSKYYSSISSNVVSSIIEDKQHNLWIGTEAEGLNYYDRKQSVFRHYKNDTKAPNSLSSNLIKSVFQDKQGNLWIGTIQGGLDLLNPATGNFKHYRNHLKNPLSLSSNDVNAVFEDSFNRFWVGTNKGLNLFDKAKGTFKLFLADVSVITRIFEDSKKNLWIGTDNGLYRLIPGDTAFKSFKQGRTGINLLRGNSINCINEDSKGNIWIGTYYSGLSVYNPKSQRLYTYHASNGLPSNNVLGVLEDGKGYLWISTDNGLSKFDIKKNRFKNYNSKDGLAGNEFNYNSFYKDSKGELFFGSLNGMISFFPDQVPENAAPAPVVFTGLKLFNNPVSTHSADHILTRDISMTENITFSHDQNIFTIDFAVLNYIRSTKNEYAYKLEGFEKNWNYVTVPSATYTNLPPGNYTFLVKGTNNDGFWSKTPAKLKIRVLPPFWKTWWAYLLYTALLVLILLVFIRFLVIRALLRREKEVHQMKLNFFTHISHEIRTPLTLILGPLEKLIKATQNDMLLQKQLVPVKNNADRLMRLITELMDFRKAETGHMKLYISPGNIVTFAGEIFLSFRNLAINRNIDYQFKHNRDVIELFFDKGQLEKVLFNLLSNGFKFTPDGGRICLSINLENDYAEIKVTDNGKGIPAESQAGLFSDFYQVDEHGSQQTGSGIGLALSKRITELHGGTITVESRTTTQDSPGYTCFTVRLHCGKAHFRKDQLLKDYVSDEDPARYILPSETVRKPGEETRPETEKKHTLLIAEDNPEVRQFIKDSLNPYYAIIECTDGLQGWEMAAEFIPDLVISDVMMPGMDGLGLCRKLKQDERTSHIPVILLTARAAYIHQIHGMETGADAYVVKPFSMQLLELNIRNLLASREAMRKKFAQVLTLQPSNVVIDSLDETFLNKVIGLIEEHITDPEFGVPMLASEVGMSQPVLYKKIRALTDLSVNDFIKSIRLKKAAQLLGQKRFTIYEVAYATGFSDRKYFSKEFRKQFGQTPTEFAGKPPE